MTCNAIFVLALLAPQVTDPAPGAGAVEQVTRVADIEVERALRELPAWPEICRGLDLDWAGERSAGARAELADEVQAWKRVLTQLSGVADTSAREALGAHAAWRLGQGLERQDQPLEAALAYQYGATAFAADRARALRSARAFQRVIDREQSSVRPTAQCDGAAADPRVAALARDAERLVSELAPGAESGELALREAERLYLARDFERARAAYLEVPSEAESHELAVVYRGVCDFQLGALDAAERTFDTYLQSHAADARLCGMSPARAARRAQAQAVAELYSGLCAYARAQRGEGDWRAVVERLGRFHEQHAAQDSFVPLALYRSLCAYRELEDSAGARCAYALLCERFPDSPWTGAASIAVYRDLAASYTEVARVDPEHASQRSVALLREMAHSLEIGNRNSPAPSFDNLRAESQHWLALGEWSRAIPVLEALAARRRESEREDVERFVLPDLARARMHTGDPEGAARLLAPQVAGEKASRATVRLYARALAGWCEFPSSPASDPCANARPSTYAGIGVPSAFAEAAALLAQVADSELVYEPAWFEATFDYLYALALWGEHDARRRAAARQYIAALAADLGCDFVHIRDPDTRHKYVWLAGALGS